MKLAEHEYEKQIETLKKYLKSGNDTIAEMQYEIKTLERKIVLASLEIGDLAIRNRKLKEELDEADKRIEDYSRGY